MQLYLVFHWAKRVGAYAPFWIELEPDLFIKLTAPLIVEFITVITDPIEDFTVY